MCNTTKHFYRVKTTSRLRVKITVRPPGSGPSGTPVGEMMSLVPPASPVVHLDSWSGEEKVMSGWDPEGSTV